MIKRLLAWLLLTINALIPIGTAQTPDTPTEAPFTPYYFNSFIQENGNGVKTQEIHGKWVAYMDEQDSWQTINMELTQDVTGFGMDRAPFTFHAPLFANGEAHFETTVRFDIFEKKKITDAPMEEWIQSLDALPVQGELFSMDSDGEKRAVLYPNAFPLWDADLIYYVQHGAAPRMQKLIRFHSAPSQNLQARFALRYAEDPDFFIGKNHQVKWDKKKIRMKKQVSIERKNSIRGMGMKVPLIWDSAAGQDRKIEEIDIDLEKAGNLYILTKNIPQSFFQNAFFPVFTDTTTTFYPDPSAETTTTDGRTVYSVDNTAWATQHAANGNASGHTDVHFDCGENAGTNNGTWSAQIRALAGFDTSSIGSSNAVSAATYSIVGASKATTITDSVNITPGFLGSNTTVANGDYQLNTSSTTWSTAIAGTAIVADDSTYNDFVLNATGIAGVNVTGVTNIAAKTVGDISNTEPTYVGGGQAQYVWDSADTAGTSKDPKLVVTYAAAATARKNKPIFLE